MRTVFAHCPACKAENALTVRVGKKISVHECGCPKCHARFDYSCWVIKRDGDVTMHQVDLVPKEAR